MELGLSRLPAAVTNGALQRTGKPSICRGQGGSLCILVLAAGAGSRVKPMGSSGRRGSSHRVSFPATWGREVAGHRWLILRPEGGKFDS